MQIILASAKIMNDRSATKGDACQSKKVKSSPDRLLRPLDAILPYRMEGNVELPSEEGQNMFCFWKG